MLSYWVNVGFFFTDRQGEGGSSISWRFPIALQILLALIMLFVIVSLDQTPDSLDSLG